MPILNILKYPDPFLKTKAKPVSKIDADIKRLILDMAETMYFARGIGLAATQVGVDKRVAVLDIPKGEDYKKGENLIVLINTEITAYEWEIKYEEGCLSIPGFTADIKRFATVTVGVKGTVRLKGHYLYVSRIYFSRIYLTMENKS